MVASADYEGVVDMAAIRGSRVSIDSQYSLPANQIRGSMIRFQAFLSPVLAAILAALWAFSSHFSPISPEAEERGREGFAVCVLHREDGLTN